MSLLSIVIMDRACPHQIFLLKIFLSCLLLKRMYHWEWIERIIITIYFSLADFALFQTYITEKYNANVCPSLQFIYPILICLNNRMWFYVCKLLLFIRQSLLHLIWRSNSLLVLNETLITLKFTTNLMATHATN